MELNRATYSKSCFLDVESVSGFFQAAASGHAVLKGSLQVSAVHLLVALPDIFARHDDGDGGRLG